jgi:hypothetical protein
MSNNNDMVESFQTLMVCLLFVAVISFANTWIGQADAPLLGWTSGVK